MMMILIVLKYLVAAKVDAVGVEDAEDAAEEEEEEAGARVHPILQRRTSAIKPKLTYGGSKGRYVGNVFKVIPLPRSCAKTIRVSFACPPATC